MELTYNDISIILKADEIEIPFGLKDDDLFNALKFQIIQVLEKSNEDIVFIGLAPDNTADNNDELLYDGQQLRIICNEKYLGVDLDSSEKEIFNAFRNMISNYKPFWTTIMEEKGFIRKETTIELFYRDPFVLE